MSRDYLNYGSHEPDDDVKIYKGKDAPAHTAAPARAARVETVEREYTEKAEQIDTRERPANRKNTRKREGRKYREITARDIAVPILAAVITAGLWIVPTEGWIRGCSFLVPYLIAGFDVFLKALERISEKEPLSEALLCTLASAAAFAIGEYIAAVLILLLFRLCQMVESYAVRRGRKQLSQLMSIRPDSANVETAEGILSVTPDYVNVGDIILIGPGERIPLDGVVIDGISTIDRSPLAGKTEAVAVTAGYRVLSGCINITSPIKVRVDRSYADSTVSRILELAEKAPENKSRQEKLIGVFGKYFTPAVLAAAVIMAIVPPIFNGEWLEYIRRASVFLLTACPGSMVISVPLAYFGGVGCAAENGVLIKGFSYLESLGNADTFVFEKTGTITEGRFSVTDVFPESIGERELLGIAATAEMYSQHPIARSLRQTSSFIAEPQNVRAEAIPGRGVRAYIGNKEILVGNAALLGENGIGYKVPNRSGTAVHVAVDGRYCGHILVSDKVRRGAFDALENMRIQGVKKTVMLTGDVLSVARPLGSKLNFDMLKAELLPEDKLAAVDYLISNKGGIGTVAFLGDGVNDAPILARADVGVVMGALGCDEAFDNADVLIMDETIGKLPVAVKVARFTQLIVKENTGLALISKFAVLALGAFGIVPIAVAALAETAVLTASLINSLRPLRAWKEQ